MSDDPEKASPAPIEPVDDDRRAIMARRSLFVAAAIAGLTRAQLGCAACLSPEYTGNSTDGAAETAPQPCLSIAIDDAATGPTDAGRDATPQPCLSPIPPDAGDDAGDDASADGGTD